MKRLAFAAWLVLLSGARIGAAAQERELVVLAEEGHLSAWNEIQLLARDFERENPGVHVKLLPLGGVATWGSSSGLGDGCWTASPCP